MKLQQISYFVTLAKTLNFTRTAEAHYVSQTAVTQQIRQLEEELGTLLFVRSNRSVSITPAGRGFYEHAVKILDLVELAKNQAREAPLEQEKLTIGVAGVDNDYVVQLMNELTVQFPDIMPDFQKCTYDAVLQGVRSRQLDLGISLEMYYPDTAEIERRVVSHLQQYIIVSNRSRFAQYKSLNRKQMEGEIFLLPRTSKDTMRAVQAHFQQSGCKNIPIHLEDTIDSALLKTAFGQGFMILAESALRWITPELNLAVILLENETIPLCFYRNIHAGVSALDALFDQERKADVTKTEC